MRILLVRGTKSILDAIGESCGGGNFSVFNTSSGDISAKIEKISPDTVLVNCVSGAPGGIPDFIKIKKSLGNKVIHSIALIGRKEKDLLPAVINAGYDDFIFRPFSAMELGTRLEIAGVNTLLRKKLFTAKKNIMTLASCDLLTGFLNRRALLDETLREMNRSARENKKLSAMLVRVAGFENHAGIQGSLINDKIMLELSRRLTEICRPYDKIGRYGIYEFMLMIPGAGTGQSRDIAARIAGALGRECRVSGEPACKPEVFIGISGLNSGEISADREGGRAMNELLLDSLVRRTELALCEAAERGHVRIAVYEAP